MTRNRRGQPRSDTAAFNDIQPDPSYIGGVAEAPFVRLPDPARIFSARARRLSELAADHTLGAYLSFLATIAAAQADCVTSLPAPVPIPASHLALRAEHGFPPISRDQVQGNHDYAATLLSLLDRVAIETVPTEAANAMASLRSMEAAERFALAGDMLDGIFDAGRLGESLFLAAALQVHLARLACQLDAATVLPSEHGICPCCGGPPVSSVVVGWTQASKARYCACSLCGTLWNHVRIRCTACGSTEGIAYYAIESLPASVGLETCKVCRCYIKHMQQHEDQRLDPIADDVASYALDLLARDEDFHRAGLNPLFLTG